MSAVSVRDTGDHLVAADQHARSVGSYAYGARGASTIYTIVVLRATRAGAQAETDRVTGSSACRRVLAAALHGKVNE